MARKPAWKTAAWISTTIRCLRHQSAAQGARPGWNGASGLAEDVRHYGQWMLEEARQKIGHLYPNALAVQEKDGAYRAATPAEIAAHQYAKETKEKSLRAFVPSCEAKVTELPVIAWIWARTVESPDPAFAGKHVPLVSTYWLCSKKGKEAWLEPVVRDGEWAFQIGTGKPANPATVKAGTKASRGANFVCLLSGAAIQGDHIKGAGKRGEIGQRLLGIVADGGRKRVYLPASSSPAPSIQPVTDPPTEKLGYDPRNIWCLQYGLEQFAELFSLRQLTALTTFSDLVGKAHEKLLADGAAPGYAAAVATYLAFAVDRLADFNNSLCRWAGDREEVKSLFARQAIPMVWDFAEVNLLGDGVGSLSTCATHVIRAIESVPITPCSPGIVAQQDAAKTKWTDQSLIISTDPPYYDNIGYADLSDFFYVWLRRSLRAIQPELTRTMLTPKSEELIATPYRHGGDAQKAKAHFENGFRDAFTGMKAALDTRFPLTVYYAMKQSEDTSGTGDSATGWETLLNSLIGSGFQITATWPVRAAQNWRMVSMGTNALASYIVLACRLRPADAPTAMRRDFLAALRTELPSALRVLQHGNIAPVDLAQAAIGPGMAIYSRHSRVLEPDGKPLTVRAALQLINQVLSETLDEQEGDFDPDTRWAVTWFKEHGFETGPYGKAEELAVAKAVSVQGLVEGGILHARGGQVRLLRRAELPDDWDPLTDTRLSIWEATEHLVRALEQGGEVAAADLLARLDPRGDAARELAYLLYTVCERKGWNKEALGYNSLVIAWPSLMESASSLKIVPGEVQDNLEI